MYKSLEYFSNSNCLKNKYGFKMASRPIFSVISVVDLTIFSSQIPKTLRPWSLTTDSDPGTPVRRFNFFNQLNLSAGVWTVRQSGIYNIQVQFIFNFDIRAEVIRNVYDCAGLQLVVNNQIVAMGTSGIARAGVINSRLFATISLNTDDKVHLQVLNPIFFGTTIIIKPEDDLCNSWAVFQV